MEVQELSPFLDLIFCPLKQYHIVSKIPTGFLFVSLYKIVYQ
jgi:hypothetical protein